MADLAHIDQDRVTQILYELRRIITMEKELKETKAKYTQEVVPLLRERGSLTIVDPIDGKHKVANVIEAETLVVDAGELLAALFEQCSLGREPTVEELRDAQDEAEMIWKSVLKPPAVDTKDEGLFHQACTPRVDEGLPPLIAPETVAKVAHYKKSAAYIGFGKVGG